MLKIIAATISLATVLFVVFLAGCKEQSKIQPNQTYTPPTKHILTISYRDASNAQALAKEHFVTGEVPAIRIKNCGGHVAFFLLVDSSSSKVIKAEKQNIGIGKTLYWPFPHLPEGSYYVVLKVPDITEKETCTFTVSR